MHPEPLQAGEDRVEAARADRGAIADKEHGSIEGEEPFIPRAVIPLGGGS